jgi:glycosyltransferase involved in cell wall biosynthesis
VRTVCYIGSVFEWFNERLVAEVAAKRLDIRFRIVGPVRRRLPVLGRMPNVELVGPIAAHDVPRELSSCDLMIVPFRSGPLATATDPLKVYEALAAGRAVLSTDLPQVRRFSPAVRVAETAAEWIRAISELESGEWDPELEKWRAVVGRSEDWRCRFNELAGILDAQGSR